jgi:hypothetical protein
MRSAPSRQSHLMVDRGPTMVIRCCLLGRVTVNRPSSNPRHGYSSLYGRCALGEVRGEKPRAQRAGPQRLQMGRRDAAERNPFESLTSHALSWPTRQ